MFHFGIMGAGKIADKFCQAFDFVSGADVSAVASKSMQRAEELAQKHGISKAYDSYEKMLSEAKPDAVYIATTPNFHLELIMLCIKYNTPVLCEKAMFTCKKDAVTAFEAARAQRVFLMEATWTLFLPNMRNMKKWITDGRIGTPVLAEASVGWIWESNQVERFGKSLPGNGAMGNVGIYGYELLHYLLGGKPDEMHAYARFADDGITDISEAVSARFGDCLAQIQSTNMSRMDEHISIHGDKGRIYAPHAHWGNESYLYVWDKEEPEVFIDKKTINGFEYEIEEVVRCVKAGKLESDVVPHSLTLACCDMFDLINFSGRKR